LSTKNKICALVATVFSGFKLCKSCIALKPSGVAALSKPKIFAVKFIVILPKAGWPLGTSGIKRRSKGSNTKAIALTTPAFSPTCINPIHRESTPIRPREISAASLALANNAATEADRTSMCPLNSCTAIASNAVIKKANHTRFSTPIPLFLFVFILLAHGY